MATDDFSIPPSDSQSQAPIERKVVRMPNVAIRIQIRLNIDPEMERALWNSRYLKESASFYKQAGHILAKRDGGYWCHYCGHQLVPHGTDIGDPEYYERPLIYRKKNGLHVYYAYRFGVREGTVDHIIPQHKGGSHRYSNLVLACRSCNSAKADRDYDEFMAGRR